MAKSIVVNSGSLLIGNPIGVEVTAEEVRGNVAFHNVKLIVKASLSISGQVEEFELSAPAGNNETVEFDVSDALRTVAGKFQFAPITANYTYPYLSYSLSAYDEYMADGILREKVGERDYLKTLYALMGAFTDIDILDVGDTKTLSAYTRKPTDGEVCSPEETLVYPTEYGFELSVLSVLESGPSVAVMPLAGKSGIVRAGNRNVYVDTESENRMCFQFVNGLGVIESCSAETLETLSTEGTTTLNVATAPSSFGKINRIFAQKNGRRASYKCSTGLVSREWAYWWHTEFFGSDKFRNSIPSSCWVMIGGRWIPCVVSLDEETMVYNDAERNGIQLDFTVTLGIDGLPYLRI